MDAKLYWHGSLGWIAAVALAGVLGSGCTTTRQAMIPVSPGYQPNNVFLADREISEHMRRVAVLPLTCDENRTELMAGRDALEPVVLAELIKTKKFEVVRISPDDLSYLTGRPRWKAGEVLPNGFFEKLRQIYGCDGVLFGELTDFRAYAPMAMGWSLKLVDSRSCSVIWAGDEQFDAGQSNVKAGALRFQHNHQWNTSTSSLNGDWVALNSPGRFGQYTVAQLFETLPGR